MLEKKRMVPKEMYNVKHNLDNEVKESYIKVCKTQKHIQELRYPNGIFSLNFLSDLIPDFSIRELQQLGLERWLFSDINDMDNFVADFQKMISSIFKSSIEKVSDANDCQDDIAAEKDELLENELNDAENYVKTQEQERMIDLDLDFDISAEYVKSDTSGIYEVNLKHLRTNINCLTPYVDDIKLELDWSWLGRSYNEVYHECSFLKCLLERIEQFLKVGESFKKKLCNNTKIVPDCSITKLHAVDKWLLYYQWTAESTKNKQLQLLKSEQNYMQAFNTLQEIRNSEHLFIMQNSAVVGMTTTGAAKMHDVLCTLNCEIGLLFCILVSLFPLFCFNF